MFSKRVIVAGALAILLAGGLGAAWAASGTALGVDPQAQADKDGATRVLTVGADIFIGDLVKTGEFGNVQIKFSDNTELVVGPNSALLIEDYLLRDDQSVGKFAVNALSGTFRFATGDASKDSYLIKTPTGTIGVRGTEFDFNVWAALTEVLLYHGSVLLCNLDNECVTLDGTCQIGTYDLSGALLVGAASETEGEQRQAFKERFEYAQDQSPLDRAFWFEKARQCFNQGFEKPFVRESKDERGCPPDYVEYEGQCYAPS
jgi:hypothetical protein